MKTKEPIADALVFLTYTIVAGVVAGFDHSGYQLPGYENPIEMLAFDDDQRNLRIDPRRLYQDPTRIQTLCAGLTEAACEQACQWAYGLPGADCRRLRMTQ